MANIVDLSGQYPYLAKGQMGQVQGLVVHHTASSDSATPQAIAAGWKNTGTSSQFIMGRDGTVYQMVPDGQKAYQIKPSWNPKIPWANNSSTLGIELIAKDDKDVTPAQVQALQQFALQQAAKYGFDPATHVVGHGEVNGEGAPPGTNPVFLRQSSEGMTAVNGLRNYLGANPTIEAQYTGSGVDAINNAAGTTPPTALAYAPPPLPIPRPNPLSLVDRLPQTAMYGLERPLVPGKVTVPPTDNWATEDQLGTPMGDTLMGMAGPRANLAEGLNFAGGAIPAPPTPMPGRPAALSVAPAAPVPQPTAPWLRPSVPAAPPTPFPTPSFALPQVQAPSNAAAPAPNLVKLPSGKMVAPGTYPSQSNPGSMVTVSDDGNGNAIVKESNLGFMNPAKMGPGTVANAYIHSQIGPAVSSAVNNVKAVVAPQASAFAGDISNGAKALGGQIGGMFSNMFGGGNSAPPTPPMPIPAPPAAPQFTLQQMQTENPAYTAWLQQQKANDIGTGPNFADLQAMNAGTSLGIPQQTPSFALPRMPSPPRFITVTRPVPVQAVPQAAPPALRLIQTLAARPPVVPAAQPGNSFLADRGINAANMSAGQQANALWQSLGGSHNGSFGI